MSRSKIFAAVVVAIALLCLGTSPAQAQFAVDGLPRV